MTILATKEQLLRNGGYRYKFQRGLYLNRELKKAFSIQFLDDHTPEEIEKAIQEPAIGRWQFFFNGGISPENAMELAKLLDDVSPHR
jgi:hypothetical protein